MNRKSAVSKVIQLCINIIVFPAILAGRLILMLKRGGKKVWQKLFFVIFIFIIFYLFIVSPSTIGGRGMSPTLLDGDSVIVNKMNYYVSEPKRGDIVIYKSPKNRDVDYVGRIIAIGNDKVQIKEGVVIVNGEALNEQYATGVTIPSETPKEGETIKVPEGSAYILMDYRLIGSDSRTFGFVPYSDFIGKPIFRHWPSNRFGLIKNVAGDFSGEDLYNSGLYFIGLKNTAKAEEYFLKAGSEFKYAPAYVELGNIYFEKKDYAKAAQYYQSSLDIDPEDAQAMHNLGSVNWNQGNTKIALEYYRKAIVGYGKVNTPGAEEEANKLKSFLSENGIKF